MKCQVTHLFAELHLLLQGWKAMRAVEFAKYRVPSPRSERQIEARLLRGDAGLRRVLSTIESSHLQ
jgi:hypothetical protein